MSWLSEQGVRGIVPMGTNGEGTAVSVDEKLGVFGELFASGFAIEIVPTVMQGNLLDTPCPIKKATDFAVNSVGSGLRRQTLRGLRE